MVTIVSMDLVQNPGEADMAIETMQPSFGGVPVILMAQNAAGSPTYYGDNDIVQSLKGVPLEEMPWKEHQVG